MMAVREALPEQRLADAEGHAKRDLQLLAVGQPPRVGAEGDLDPVVEHVLGLDVEVDALLRAVEAPVELLGLVVVLAIGAGQVLAVLDGAMAAEAFAQFGIGR